MRNRHLVMILMSVRKVFKKSTFLLEYQPANITQSKSSYSFILKLHLVELLFYLNTYLIPLAVYQPARS